MRARELLKEDENLEFESDLEDLIVAAKANGLTEVDTEDLVDQLVDMGHSVTADSLVNALDVDENEFVKNVTLNTITFKDHVVDDEEGAGDYEDEEPDAERIATKTAMKGVKKNRKREKQQAKDQL